jgi:hypothetical protein
MPKVWLLEYDKRFEVFPEFVFYDFKNPMKLPREFSLDWTGWGDGLMRGMNSGIEREYRSYYC